MKNFETEISEPILFSHLVDNFFAVILCHIFFGLEVFIKKNDELNVIEHLFLRFLYMYGLTFDNFAIFFISYANSF